MRRGPLLALALGAVLLAAACEAAPAATPSPTPSPSPTPEPAADLPIPNGDPSREQVLLRSADGRFDPYSSVGQLQGAPMTCTAVLLDTGGPAGGPAYALTNGHCLGINGANEVVTDRAAEGIAVAFEWFVDVPDHRVVPVTAVTWATMRGTDLALLELEATPGELRALGLRGWRPQAVPADRPALDVLMLGIPVGVPIEDIPEAERYLRLGTCTLDTAPVVVNERQWLWPGSLRNDCPEVLPGNSGSAVIDRSTGGLVGLINTTTYRGDDGAACWLGRPCEVSTAGEVPLVDTSYAQPVAALLDCFGDDGAFALGGACGLPGVDGVLDLEGAPLAVNPFAADPISGAPGRTTWATTVVAPGAPAYRAKIGPLGTTSCADPAGYGDPAPVSEPIDDPLPATEQRLLLCVIAGDQAPATAALAVASIDTTPPTVPVTFASSGNARDGWRAEPVFNPPELSLFLVKWGPRRATDCGDPDGYRPYRRQPLVIEAADAPARLCAIGYDDAGNAGEPGFIDLE